MRITLGLRRSEFILMGMLLLATLFGALRGYAQQKADAPPTASLLVDFMITDKGANPPAQGLTKADFQIMDGRSRIPILSFAHAPEVEPRPLIIWLIVQCPLEGIATAPSWVSNGSGFMREGHERHA